MSKLTKMFGILDKNKKQEDNLDDLGLVFPDEEEQPTSPTEVQKPQTIQSPNNINKIPNIDNNKKKEEITNEKKNPESKSGPNLSPDIIDK